jgi:hypothetical protein
MVGERGFEPPTPWSRTRCSTRLSHSPTSNGRWKDRECAQRDQPIIAFRNEFSKVTVGRDVLQSYRSSSPARAGLRSSLRSPEGMLTFRGVPFVVRHLAELG